MRLPSSWIPWVVLVLASIIRAQHTKKHGIQEAEDRTFYQGGWIPMVAPCPTCRKRDTSQETQDFPSQLTDFHHPPPPPLAQMLQDFTNFKSHHIKTPLGTGTEILGSTLEPHHRGRETFSTTDDINLLRFHQSRGLLMPHLHMPHASQLISGQSHQVSAQPFVSDLSTLRTNTENQQEFLKMTENDEKESQNQNKEVQLLYVPVETLKERYNEKNRDNKEAKQRENVAQQSVSPSIASYTTEHQLGLQGTFIPQTTVQGFHNNNFDHTVENVGTRHRFYNQGAGNLDQSTPDTRINKSTTGEANNSSNKLKAHTPPLSVFMDSSGEKIKVSDVVRILKDANTVAVLDHVGPDSPNVFIGPSNLNTPSYTKFELPYLSSIDSNRVERKVERLPFFVAPLNFKPPQGYSKIPLPAPHVGSVVIKQETSVHKGELQRSKSQVTTPTNPYSLPLDLLPINPELPSLVNSLQDTNQDDVLLVPDTGNSNPQQPETHSFSSSSSIRPSPTVPTRQHHSTLQPTVHNEFQTEPITLHTLTGRIRNPVQIDTHNNRIHIKQQPIYNTQDIHTLTQIKTEDLNEDSKTNEQIVLNTKIHPKTKIVNFFSLQNDTDEADFISNTEKSYENKQLPYKNVKSQAHQQTSEKTELYNQHTLSPQLETVTSITHSPNVQHFSVEPDYFNRQIGVNPQFLTENKNPVQSPYIFSHANNNEYVPRVPLTTIGPNIPVIKDDHILHQKEVTTERAQSLNSQFYFPNLQQSQLSHLNTETGNLHEEPTNTEVPKTYSQHINNAQSQSEQIQELPSSTTTQNENKYTSTVSPSTVFPNRRQKQRSRTRSTTTTPSPIQTTPSSRRTNSRSRRPAQTRTRVQNKEPANKASVPFEETRKPQTFNNEQNTPSINNNENQQYTNTEQQNINYRISTENIPDSDPHTGFAVHQPTHSMLNGFISTSQPSYHYNVFHSTQPQQFSVQQSESELSQTDVQDTTTITNSPKPHRFRERPHPQRLQTYTSLQTPVTENLVSTTSDISDSITHAEQSKRVTSDVYSQRTSLKDNDNLYISQITTEPVHGFTQKNNSRNLNVNLPETSGQSQFYQHQQVPFEQSQFPVYEQEHSAVHQQREKIKVSHLHKPRENPTHETASSIRHGVHKVPHQNQYIATVQQNQNLVTERNPSTGFTASQIQAFKTENPVIFYPSQQIIYPHQQTTLRIQPVYSHSEQTTPYQDHEPVNSEFIQGQNQKQIINMHGFLKHQTAETPVISDVTSKNHPVYSVGQILHTNEHLQSNAQPEVLYSVSPSTPNSGNIFHISNNRNTVPQNQFNYTALIRDQQQNDPSNLYFSANVDIPNENKQLVNSESPTIHNRAHEVTSPATVVSLPSPETSISHKPISQIDITTFRNMILLHASQAAQVTPRTRTRARVRHRDSQNRNHEDSREIVGSQRTHSNGQISDVTHLRSQTSGSNANTDTFFSSTDASNFQGQSEASREKYQTVRQFSPRYRTTSEEVSDSNTETSVFKNQRTKSKISARPPSLPITQENIITTTTESSNKVYTIRPIKRTNLPTKIQSTRGRIRKPTSTTTTTTTTSTPTVETTLPSFYNRHHSTTNNFLDTNVNKIYTNQNEIRQQGSFGAYTPEQISRFSDTVSVSPKNISPFRNYNLNDYQDRTSSQYNNQGFPQNPDENSSEDYSLYDQRRYESSVRSLVYNRDGLADQNVQESKWFAGPPSNIKTLTEENTSIDRSSEYSAESTTEYNNDYTKYDNHIESNNESNEEELLSFENMPKPFTLPDETTSKSDTYSYTIIHDKNSKSDDTAVSKPKNRRKGTWVRVAVKPHHKDVLETAESQNVAAFSNNIVPTAPLKKTSPSHTDKIYYAPTTPATFPQTVQPKDSANAETTTETSMDDLVSTTIEPTKHPNHKYDSDENVNITLQRNKYENKNKKLVDIWNMSNYTNNNDKNSHTTDKNQTINKIFNDEGENEQIASTTESSAEYILTTEVPIVTTSSFSPVGGKSEEDVMSFGETHSSSEESEESIFDYLGNIFGNREEVSPSTKQIFDRNDQYTSTEKSDKKNKTLLKDKKYDKEKLTNKEEISVSKTSDKYILEETEKQKTDNGKEEKQIIEASQGQNKSDSNFSTEENKNSEYISDPLMSAEIQEMMAKVANFDSTESTVPTIDFDIQKTKALQKSVANLTSATQSQILGTSTSTEISHETEICYRGRCVKTKTIKNDEDDDDRILNK